MHIPSFVSPTLPSKSLHRCLSRTHTPLCSSSPGQSQEPQVARTPLSQPSEPPHTTLLAVERRLIDELPTLFTSSDPDYSIYASDVTFEDPLNRFRGTSRYRANIRLLTNSPLFSAATFFLHSTAILPESVSPLQQPTVRTRWTLTLCFSAAPWRPRPAFTGQSDYVVDVDTGLVTQHLDYWDSLADNSFPSPAGLADFVRQCAPANANPPGMPDHLLLRRTRDFQIWRFDSTVHLQQRQQQQKNPSGSGGAILFDIVDDVGSINTAEASTPLRVQTVASIRIGTSPPTQAKVDEVGRTLRLSLTNVPYAVATDQVVCAVVPNGRGAHFTYYVWLLLAEASAPVDV